MKNQLLGLRKRKTHPDDDIMMSYAAKGFVEGVKRRWRDSHHPTDW